MDLNALKARCESNPYMRLNRISFRDAGENWVELSVTAGDELLNPVGLVHGGVLFTLGDCAAGLAAHLDGRRHVTLSSTLNFLRSGLPGDVLSGRGTVRRRGEHICFLDVEVKNQRGELLASGSYTFFHVEE